MECRFPNDKAYPSELDNELPLKVNTDRSRCHVQKLEFSSSIACFINLRLVMFVPSGCKIFSVLISGSGYLLVALILRENNMYLGFSISK